jgi:HSP20 family protein
LDWLLDCLRKNNPKLSSGLAAADADLGARKSSAEKGIFTMNALTRWNPFKEMEEIQDRLTSLWDRFPTPHRSRSEQESLATFGWSPMVDIVEDNNEYLIKADLPEVKKSEISVTVENGLLKIRGERKYETEDKSRTYHRVERSYGKFERSFSIPGDADGTKISAEFKDGVLMVHLPKDEKAKPKAVDVKVA